MRIQILYFASVREDLGLSSEVVDLPDNVATLGGLREYLCRRGGKWNDVLSRSNLCMAYDKKIARADTPLSDGGEAAFFPPVTGG